MKHDRALSRWKHLLYLLSLISTLLSPSANADGLPGYSMGIPMPVGMNVTTDAAKNGWFAANNVFVANADYYSASAGVTNVSPAVTGKVRYALGQATVGASWEISKPQYYLADRIDAPDDVDWDETYAVYQARIAAGESAATTGFIFCNDPDARGVFASAGGTHTIDWVLADGTVNRQTYTFASVTKGRPKRIYWTDYPYNGEKVSMSGKFVKFFGPANLATPNYGTVTNESGGVKSVQQNVVVSGLYLDPSSMSLEARGTEVGQVVMVYYADGTYSKILHVQTIEVCKPDTIFNDGTIGEPLKPNGRGYAVEGLTAIVRAGVGDVLDGRGDYLYQHAGEHGYSPHNGDVYPIRPTVGERWKAEICWMEEDPMKVLWPFEIDQYENTWPDDMPIYVRGDLEDDSGAAVTIPADYTATLMTYQDPEGHADDVDADGNFLTDLSGFGVSEGCSLLKLDGDDNVWFVPVKSVMRSNADYYTLAPIPLPVGHEARLDGVPRTAFAPGAHFTATPAEPGYVYQAGTPVGNYDLNVYGETNSASAIYPISAAGDIEVWWRARVTRGDMPVPIVVPTLATVFRPSWPAADEAPQIVLASQKGGATTTLYGHYGAATFDAPVSKLAIPTRTYFPGGSGTFAFWTRAAATDDPIEGVTNAVTGLCQLGNDTRSLTLRIGEDEQLELLLDGMKIGSAAYPKKSVPNSWTHLALALSGGTNATFYVDGQSAWSGPLADAAFLGEPLNRCALGIGETASTKVTEEVDTVGKAGASPENAVDCATWSDVKSNLEVGNNVRLTADMIHSGVISLSGKTVTLDLNGHTVRTGFEERFFRLENGSKLSIVGTGVFDGEDIEFTYVQGRFALVSESSSFEMYAGVTIKNMSVAFSIAGAVWIVDDSSFTMHGGTFIGCSARNGGAVYVQSGTFTMNGGLIENCTANVSGGAVYVIDTFTLNGGVIRNCKAKSYGGSVYVYSNGSLTMNGGAIQGGSATYGGGVAVFGGGSKMALKDGMIKDCQGGLGGGVFTQAGALTISGGRIGNNSASTCGGGVYTHQAQDSFAMTGGEIADNSAPTYPCVGAKGGSLAVFGGTFDVAPTAANFCSDGVSYNAPRYYYDWSQRRYVVEGDSMAVGRQVAEVVAFDHALTAEELASERYRTREGSEIGITGYWSFRPGEDLVATEQSYDVETRTFTDRGREDAERLTAYNVTLSLPGAPLRSPCVIYSDTEPTVYRQSDPNARGYNPNEEHAFVEAGQGGYVVWALRCDLGKDGAPQGVFAEYTKDGRNKVQFFHVVATNADWPTFGMDCTAGLALPGPIPLTTMMDPWQLQDKWTGTDAVYRDRKTQLWCRAGGREFDFFKYYANQATFDWPTLSAPPAVGTAVPWLSALGTTDRSASTLISGTPVAWHFQTKWPKHANAMKIGQTLTVAENDLPEVWAAKSVAVVYPGPGEGTDVVMLSDPTVKQSVSLALADFKATGLSTEPNGGLVQRKGMYYFTEASPFLSSRLYYDPTTEELCLIGDRPEKNAGVTILFPNVLTAAERQAVKSFLPDSVDNAARVTWEAAVDALATTPVEPNTMAFNQTAAGGKELQTTYRAVDHYALTAMGATNWVVLVENDASQDSMAVVDGVQQACSVADGDPINMHVFYVTNVYYTAKVVSREDENNLLSQQLSVLYTDPIGGKADDFEFEWAHHLPSADGTVPKNYGAYTVRAVNAAAGETAYGLTRFVVGQQGDTLANMVNTYWNCRYRAKPGTAAYATMGDAWSGWCEDPGLAEGWVQRVLNNVTPFNQRMTDMMNNRTETAVSMIQIAGGPFTGDVALNQDNLTNVGLIQLYETILNKAESLSILLGDTPQAACQQLLLAVERLHDLYMILGDEAYTDAKDPTIGFGNNIMSMENEPSIQFDAMSTSLFAFDNQVNSLLDEELCLLRGRSGVSAPSTHNAPYYNRLVWNFTKGITAGEVAYVVNYDVNGGETLALSEEQAARVYPQGHGDAYGHYLSALKGWYRLLRNPNFTWGEPVQGEMNVADAPINVDYYEEAKFAKAAANLAKTAADVTDLTARYAWREAGENVAMPGYLDSNVTNAFGYGEWASRGGYGALVNWVVANSLLPADATLASDSSDSSSSSSSSGSINYTDSGLKRIDRGNTAALVDICNSAAKIVEAVDRVDAGENPLGLSDNAIPFDLDPNGVSDGSNTHYEQIRDRAKVALANARKILVRAQEQQGRVRRLAETCDVWSGDIECKEFDYETELIGYFGTPYTDDIGPGKTYAQGYEGPDVLHYGWMDLSLYGISASEIKDTVTVLKIYNGADLKKISAYAEIDQFMNEKGTVCSVPCLITRTGLTRKPDSIRGYRVAPGSIQEKYGEFLAQYLVVWKSQGSVGVAEQNYQNTLARTSMLRDRADVLFGLEEALKWAKQAFNIYEQVKACTDAISAAKSKAVSAANETAVMLTPLVAGAGTTVVTSPRSVVEATQAAEVAITSTADASAQATRENIYASFKFAVSEAEAALATAESAFSLADKHYDLMVQLRDAAAGLVAVYKEHLLELAALNNLSDSVATEIAAANRLLDTRELDRQQQVDQFEQMRYNEMFFRMIRDKTLAQYTAAFDIAQKYVYMAAQTYDYETGLMRSKDGSRDDFKAKIVTTRALGAFDEDGEPIVADDGDLGLAGYLAQMDANWQVLKPRLGLNNPQPYATWFSLRKELFRILPGEDGDAAWAKELTKYWVDDVRETDVYRRHCQQFQSQYGLKDKEPGLVIPFSTTIDFAKNFFGQDLAGGDHAYDSTWYATKIAAAGVWFEGYNEKTANAGRSVQPLLAATPTVYLIPAGHDCLRAPGQADGKYWQFTVVDQVIPAPYAIGSYELDSDTWFPSMNDADWGEASPTAKIRKHPMFRAYYGDAGVEPDDGGLDATRLIGRSVWNDQWYLIIPAGSMNADRDKALSVFINGSDTNRDGKLDIAPVSDIRIGFRSYSNSGN